MLSTMVQSKPGSAGGHHHAGDGHGVSISDRRVHLRSVPWQGFAVRSTLPRWYVGTFDPIANTIRIMRYAVGKDSVVQEDLIETFAMPSIDAP